MRQPVKRKRPLSIHARKVFQATDEREGGFDGEGMGSTVRPSRRSWCSALHGNLADAGDSSRRQQQGDANGSSSFGQHSSPSDMNQPTSFSYQ